MISWPALGTRVMVRYRREDGSVPPLTDAVGHLLAVDPVVRLQTKTGAVVECSPADVVMLRVLTFAPVRTSDIRALEHAAAMAWPGVEHAWLEGWLLRAGPPTSKGTALPANSAVPLDISSRLSTVPAIVDWYEHRGLAPRLAIPDRLLSVPTGSTGEHPESVLVRDVSDMAAREPDPSVSLSARPDDAWLRLFGHEVGVEVLSAVGNGELMFGTLNGAAVARAAVTDAPDGARWVGLSAIGGDDRTATALCEALLAWGAARGATRGYVAVPDAEADTGWLGFRLHHHRRYFPVRRTT
ncbi:GCN5 family acetyltransferase [Mycobacterium sp. 852002-10029_SCH5224772]|uniref:N-acetylglutamate synthase, CG3035 family n=1 Tax=Mycobacterium sp. 852002-10029_SCH5224772 TaxID=1834083 RepID=UPI0007FD9533|nr:GCN5 family acetyltransferase [Mycobacterium sp. 852002-10029_SCH5224772]OBE95657.1 GCN5 family acetyltransferase [Mycobacterium sp. 852002-10029_SCH5224772]